MGNSLGFGRTEDGTRSERDNGKEEELSTSERPLKTSELANEENERVPVFESNRRSQDEGNSSLNFSTFHNNPPDKIFPTRNPRKRCRTKSPGQNPPNIDKHLQIINIFIH